jgi:soluble lytic murein transglycosylase-like protein
MPESRISELACAEIPAAGPPPSRGRYRQEERRSRIRRVSRRRLSRRGARVRNVLLSVLAVAVPPRAGSLLVFSNPTVSVTVDKFEAIAPRAKYEDLILEAAATYRLDPALIRSVIQAESQFNAAAVSGSGAGGLMQLMPSVANSLGVIDLLDPRENVMAGARLLRQLLDRFNGSLPLALAGYNAGAAAVARFGCIPPFPETQAYVKKVTRLMKKSRETGGA